MKKSISYLIITAGLLFFLNEPVLATHPAIIISTFEEPTPFRDIAESVMTEAYRRMGLRMELKRFPGERSIHIANSGNVDGELYRMEGISNYFPNLFVIPIPISNVEFFIFTKDKVFPVKGWESLISLKVGYKRGIKAIETHLPKGAETEPVSTWEQAFRKVNIGRNDVVISTLYSAYKTINELGLKNFVKLEPPLITTYSYHYLHATKKHLIKPLTTILQEMENQGLIHDIQKQFDPVLKSTPMDEPKQQPETKD